MITTNQRRKFPLAVLSGGGDVEKMNQLAPQKAPQHQLTLDY